MQKQKLGTALVALAMIPAIPALAKNLRWSWRASPAPLPRQSIVPIRIAPARW
jgi:hypothetical protein